MAEPMSLGPPSDVPEGEMRSFQIGGEDIAVANVGGTWYAFGDTCTHRQCSLSDGDLEDITVTCPCHGSQFDVTNGEVLNPPATQPVPSYQVEVSDGELKIAL